ncbi:MAG: HemK2/MTQ2 family protein methyltransferase [Candidatus Micrarchaeia archaeon]
MENKPTDFCGLSLRFHPDVYEPSDDSELMVEAARKFAFGKVLDLGCATGVFGIACAQRKEVSSVVCADLNPSAVEIARKNAALNGVEKKMSFAQTDLFSAFEKGAKNELFDVIGFNPPYLPTTPAERVHGTLNLAFDGGKSGRKITDLFLKSFDRHLAQGGVLILLQSSLSGIGKTIAILEKKGFEVEKLPSKKFFFEEICVLVARKVSEPENASPEKKKRHGPAGI